MKTILLTRDHTALVDDSDYERVHNQKWHLQINRGTLTVKKYAARIVCKSTSLMHREIMCPAPGLIVDHINGDGLDNRRANLRVCTQAENRRNARIRANAKSPYKGIEQRKDRFLASIQSAGKRKFLGSFDTAEIAARAYDSAAMEIFGEFACLNFPHADDRCAIDEFHVNMKPVMPSFDDLLHKVRSDSVSGLKGTRWHKASNKWTSSIQVNGIRRYLGLFATADEAHRAYMAAAELAFIRKGRAKA